MPRQGDNSSTGRQLRRLFGMLQEVPFQPGTISQSRPISDPRLQSAGTVNSLWHMPFIAIGTITDCTTLAQVYRVQFEKGVFTMPCFLAPHTSLSAYGARSLATLQPGTSVICSVHMTANYGIILGTLPPSQLSGNRHLMQQLRFATRNRVDEAHKKPLRMTDNGMIPDQAAGRPFDSTCVGEEGWITETGLRIFIDPFMVEMAVDEACGISAFFHDQLLRIAGYNLQTFTACSESYAMNDQEEGYAWTGYTPYPWEQLGQFDRKDPRKEFQPKEWQVSQPHNGPWEPAISGAEEPRLQPWHREVHYHGYLGQGGKHTIYAPPKSPPAGNTFAGGQGEEAKLIGLFDHSVGLDGRAVTVSAKGISIIKRPAIPGPKRLRTPEQVKDEGDNEKNYKAAGKVGGGPEHKITGDLQTSGSYPSLQTAAGILDLHAYLVNYSGIHPFFWHAKDWRVDQESEFEHTEGMTIEVPNFSRLLSSLVIPPPTAKKIKVDHRFNEQDFYPNESSIDLLPDGGIVIADGFGSTITMAGGKITFAAAGDVEIKSGRDTLVWGGHDVIIRAKNCVEATTTEGDLRLKSEKNMHFLAGNEVDGGMLFECRAPSATYQFEGKQGTDVVSGNIMFRAEHGDLASWTKNAYIRTGGPDIEAGTIVLDANKGKSDIVTHSQALRHYMNSGALWLFGTEGNVRKANEFSEDVTTIGSDFCVNGRVLAQNDVLIKGFVMVSQGHIATEYSEQASNFVEPLKGQALNAVNTALSDCLDRAERVLINVGTAYYQQVLQTEFYTSGRPGNDAVIRNAKFSLRSIAQYRTQEWKMFEDHWQQLARLSGSTLQPWEEKPVKCPIDPRTFPYPGREHYDGQDFFQQPLEIFELSGTVGHAKDRGTAPSLADPYATPKFGEPKPASLLKDYKVIR